jgi:hypothetical protein
VAPESEKSTRLVEHRRWMGREAKGSWKNHAIKAFSSEVDTGSREENASKN